MFFIEQYHMLNTTVERLTDMWKVDQFFKFSNAFKNLRMGKFSIMSFVFVEFVDILLHNLLKKSIFRNSIQEFELEPSFDFWFL